MTVLVPEPILHAMAPALVEDFHACHPQKKIDEAAIIYGPVRKSFFFPASEFMTMTLLSDSVRYSSEPQRQKLAWSCYSGEFWPWVKGGY